MKRRCRPSESGKLPQCFASAASERSGAGPPLRGQASGTCWDCFSLSKGAWCPSHTASAWMRIWRERAGCQGPGRGRSSASELPSGGSSRGWAPHGLVAPSPSTLLAQFRRLIHWGAPGTVDVLVGRILLCWGAGPCSVQSSAAPRSLHTTRVRTFPPSLHQQKCLQTFQMSPGAGGNHPWSKPLF